MAFPKPWVRKAIRELPCFPRKAPISPLDFMGVSWELYWRLTICKLHSGGGPCFCYMAAVVSYTPDRPRNDVDTYFDLFSHLSLT